MVQQKNVKWQCCSMFNAHSLDELQNQFSAFSEDEILSVGNNQSPYYFLVTQVSWIMISKMIKFSSSSSPCSLAWFKIFFFWIWGLIFGYVFRLGKTRLHEFFQIYRPINTSWPPMWSFNGNFNGKMAKNRFLAIKSSRSVLQPSSYHCWATFS